jgi:peptide/nickel transport system substrate-binding protein
MRNRPIGRRTALLGASAVMVGSGPSHQAEARGDRTKLIAGIQSDALTLDPTRDQSSIAMSLFNNIYDALTSIGRDGGVEPGIAESWDASPDAKIWTFKIRAGMKFHDGTPVTADDVISSYQRVRDDPTSPIRLYLNKVAGFEKVGDAAVRFTLSESFAPFPRQVSLIFIVPNAAYMRLGAQEFSRHPVGSGAFQVVEWVKDDRIVLKAFADHWGGAPKIENLIFRPVPAETSRSSALLSGELDVVPALPPILVSRLQSASDVSVVLVPGNRVMYIGFNSQAAPLNNLKLRQAIDCGINREAITKRLLAGAGNPIGEIVSPVVFGFDPKFGPTPYDPAKARELVKESGYGGQPIALPYPNNIYPMADQLMQVVAASLKDIGVNVELQGTQYSAFFPMWSANKFTGAYFSGFGPSIMDADLPISSMFETGSHGYYSNPEVDGLIAAQRAEPDPVKRRRDISKIWDRVKADLPVVPLYQEVLAYGMSKGLEWKPRPDGLLIFRDAAWS